MTAYVGAAGMLLLALVGIGGAYGVHRLTAVAPDPVLCSPYASGGVTTEYAVSRFHARWYALSFIFLAFDVEMLFMYPWAVVVADVGVSAVVEMFGFFVVLMAAVVYAWREGALRWA